MNVQQVKQRFGIIGNHYDLNRAIDIAMQVAPTDLTVFITGESGTGKETFPKIIHQFGVRKHGQYIAVNCGAIPEGTIDSELFGHEKGAFTGATDTRKGYFEVADRGTIFLDEVAELPLSTQVRLLRILESKEFIRVGSSKVIKTDVRVVAATNVNIPKAVEDGKFREDLYYRLNTVPISIPPLRERKDDIYLLFRKFAQDAAERFQMPAISLDDNAKIILEDYRWPGNIRQLKNITEQVSILEKNRTIQGEKLESYLPAYKGAILPAIYKDYKVDEKTFNSEREILYNVLFDMKNDMNDLKKLVYDLIKSGADNTVINENHAHIIRNLKNENTNFPFEKNSDNSSQIYVPDETTPMSNIQDTEEFVEESLMLTDKEKELILRALKKHKGKRKAASEDLGISERTLYRKIKDYNIDL